MQRKHIQYWNFAESQGEKRCLRPKEEYVTLHGAYPDKNNYSYLERNFKSFKFYVARYGPTETSSPGRAVQGNFRQGLLTWGQNKRTPCVNNEDEPLSENYTLAPGKLFHTENHRISPCPWARYLAAVLELGASQLGHKAKSISAFPSQENHFPVVPFISA